MCAPSATAPSSPKDGGRYCSKCGFFPSMQDTYIIQKKDEGPAPKDPPND